MSPICLDKGWLFALQALDILQLMLTILIDRISDMDGAVVCDAKGETLRLRVRLHQTFYRQPLVSLHIERMKEYRVSPLRLPGSQHINLTIPRLDVIRARLTGQPRNDLRFTLAAITPYLLTDNVITPLLRVIGAIEQIGVLLCRHAQIRDLVLISTVLQKDFCLEPRACFAHVQDLIAPVL